jgi:hypothetical protein
MEAALEINGVSRPISERSHSHSTPNIVVVVGFRKCEGDQGYQTQGETLHSILSCFISRSGTMTITVSDALDFFKSRRMNISISLCGVATGEF